MPTDIELAGAAIREQAEYSGVTHLSPAIQCCHHLASLVQWCDAQDPKVDLDAELAEVREHFAWTE